VSRGSGYTSLFAKYIAFGSLPFANAKEYVKSVYVNNGVLNAIKRGDSIVDGKSFAGRPLQILRRLPYSKQIDAYYHWSAVKDLNLQPVSKHELGRFYKTDKQTAVELRRQRSTRTKPLEPAVPQKKTNNHRYLLPFVTPTTASVRPASSISLKAI
jgi:hypothetical protein